MRCTVPALVDTVLALNAETAGRQGRAETFGGAGAEVLKRGVWSTNLTLLTTISGEQTVL